MDLKKKTTTESPFPATVPFRAAQVRARVELTTPTSHGAEAQTKVTKENIVDIQRYLRWADKAIKPQSPKKQSFRENVGAARLRHARG